jgi:hypothetical protein
MKKTKMMVVLMMVVFVLAACGNAGGEVWTVTNAFSYNDISKWGTMQTPSEGSGSGSVVETNTKDGYVTIKAADDGWGGLESDYFEIDLDKNPMIFAQIFENPDGSNWGMKVIPENPREEHKWGLYLVEDNNLKWNKYAGVDVSKVLDADFVAIYGSKLRVKIWIYAVGGPEALVSVSGIKVLNAK